MHRGRSVGAALVVPLAILVSALPLAAAAEERATPKEAEAMVRQAIAFLKKEGREKALATFSDLSGPFTYRDLYIAAYDFEGKCVAHGAKKDRVGKNLIDDKDADGKPFVRERVALMKAKGKGWQEYKFLNPVTKKIEQKVAYCEAAGDVILCCGAYQP